MTIIEILAAYVRQNSPNEEPRNRSKSRGQDIQASLNVLGFIDKRADGMKLDDPPFSLSSTDLSGYQINGDFSCFLFCNCNLERSIMKGAKFCASDFSGSTMNNADLSFTNLECAKLSGTIGLTKEQLEWAVIDEETDFPEELKEDPQWDAWLEVHLGWSENFSSSS